LAGAPKVSATRSNQRASWQWEQSWICRQLAFLLLLLYSYSSQKRTPNRLPTVCPEDTFPYFRVAISAAKSVRYQSARTLITQRSVVQIHPPQPLSRFPNPKKPRSSQRSLDQAADSQSFTGWKLIEMGGGEARFSLVFRVLISKKVDALPPPDVFARNSGRGAVFAGSPQDTKRHDALCRSTIRSVRKTWGEAHRGFFRGSAPTRPRTE